MTIPAAIRAGDTVAWTLAATTDALGNSISSASWTLTTYFRTAVSGEAVTAVGVADSSGGWTFTITAGTTAGMDAGTWYWQAVATDGSSTITIGSGSLTVQPSLAYSGTAAAFDGRSQAQQDLNAVQTAIRGIISGKAKQYTIGSRNFTSLDLPALMQRESQLKAIVAKEKAAESVAAGLGDPRRVFVRFTA